MPIRALAADYDGTLATLGEVRGATLDALRRLKASGRWLLLVTGRRLPDLERVFGEVNIFDAVVAENGALLALPRRAEVRRLAPGPPPLFLEDLGRRRVEPLAVGQTVVATVRDNEA